MWYILIVVLVTLIISIYLFRTSCCLKRVTVVALGDIGRSPRIRYHALSLVKEGFDVDFVGYPGMRHAKYVCHLIGLNLLSRVFWLFCLNMLTIPFPDLDRFTVWARKPVRSRMVQQYR